MYPYYPFLFDFDRIRTTCVMSGHVTTVTPGQWGLVASHLPMLGPAAGCL